jgi:23S rRNA (guanine2445-N2)-methyltransferase / 23S rRNA (guanine2069-N7)-methyltransferase
LGKHLGLRAKRLHTLYNGTIECKLLHFEVTPDWYYANRQHPRPIPQEERSEGAAMFANRLQKNLKHLGRWAKREGIHCYRLYDSDLPEYALAIDVYEAEKRWTHAQEYEAPKSIDPRKARLRLREALGVILETLQIPEEQLFFKVRRPQKGAAQYQRLASGGRFHKVQEGNCGFLVNFEDYLDTGLFLDHRMTRNLLGELADGKRFLNLFAYTAAATVYAAKGGARSTTSVDLSNTYLDWAKRNMALNGFTSAAHQFLRADCVQWLDEAAAKHRYGLIFLDPPTFSTSKRMSGTLDVQRDHGILIQKTAKLLEPGGILIFSNNLRRFKMDLRALSDLVIEDITRTTLPKDFERNPRIHNCWMIRRDSAPAVRVTFPRE